MPGGSRLGGAASGRSKPRHCAAPPGASRGEPWQLQPTTAWEAPAAAWGNAGGRLGRTGEAPAGPMWGDGGRKPDSSTASQRGPRRPPSAWARSRRAAGGVWGAGRHGRAGNPAWGRGTVRARDRQGEASASRTACLSPHPGPPPPPAPPAGGSAQHLAVALLRAPAARCALLRSRPALRGAPVPASCTRGVPAAPRTASLLFLRQLTSQRPRVPGGSGGCAAPVLPAAPSAPSPSACCPLPAARPLPPAPAPPTAAAAPHRAPTFLGVPRCPPAALRAGPRGAFLPRHRPRSSLPAWREPPGWQCGARSLPASPRACADVGLGAPFPVVCGHEVGLLLAQGFSSREERRALYTFPLFPLQRPTLGPFSLWLGAAQSGLSSFLCTSIPSVGGTVPSLTVRGRGHHSCRRHGQPAGSPAAGTRAAREPRCTSPQRKRPAAVGARCQGGSCSPAVAFSFLESYLQREGAEIVIEQLVQVTATCSQLLFLGRALSARGHIMQEVELAVQRVTGTWAAKRSQIHYSLSQTHHVRSKQLMGGGHLS